jgi:hypothetical protein
VSNIQYLKFDVLLWIVVPPLAAAGDTNIQSKPDRQAESMSRVSLSFLCFLKFQLIKNTKKT